jgi:hypothetical protein
MSVAREVGGTGADFEVLARAADRREVLFFTGNREIVPSVAAEGNSSRV